MSPEHIKHLIKTKTRRLEKLKEQQALEGNRTDPAILIEIEDIEAEIEEYKQKLEILTVDQETSFTPHTQEEINDSKQRESNLKAEPVPIEKDSGKPIKRVWKMILVLLLIPLLIVVVITIFMTTNDNSDSVCPKGSDDVFEQVLMQNTELARTLGGLKLGSTPIRVAYLSFEKGFMIFNGTAKDIHVFFNNESRWKIFEDTWTSKNPEFSCDGDPPDGRFQPAWGFGKVWCENKEVKDGLGFATMQEETTVDLLLQSYDGGWLIFLDNNIYVLVNSDESISGTWKEIPIYNYNYKTIPLKLLSELSSPETNLGLNVAIAHSWRQSFNKFKIRKFFWSMGGSLTEQRIGQ